MTELAAEYWDCECAECYVHRNAVSFCPVCNTSQETQPNARVAEVSTILGIPESEIRRLA